MNTLTLELRELTEELATKASQYPLDEEDLSRLKKTSFDTEGRVLNALMTYPHRNQQEIFLNIQLQSVRELNNTLFRAAGMQQMIRPYVSLLTAVSARLFRAVPGIEIASLPISDAFRLEQYTLLEKRWQQLMDIWRKQGIEERFMDICRQPLARLAAKELVYRVDDYRYLQRYLEELENLDLGKKPDMPLLGHSLMELLIALEFNSLRFCGHCIRTLRANLRQVPDLRQQQVLLENLAGQLHDLKPLSGIRFGNDHPLLESLTSWIKMEVKSLEKQISRQEFSYKIQKNLSVEEEAVFEKLLMDVGLTLEESLDVLARKIAHNYRSKQQPELSADRLKKLFSNKDPEVFASIRIWLRKLQEEVEGYLKI